MTTFPFTPKTIDEEVADLSLGAVQMINQAELAKKIAKKKAEGKPLRVKLGVDPTSPDIHFGHTVVLQKLRQFQDMGHQAVLIIGDYTAMIGDPSGRSSTRPQLTHEEIKCYAKTYQEQAFKVLDRNKTELRFNGEWLAPMSFFEVMKLNSRMTLQQLLQREDFRNRMEKAQPIHAHELQYPMMQGWDSVQIEADVELGGTDQLFNLLVGRDLQQQEGQEPQVVMTMPLLVGLDGVKKMSKSLGNSIGVQEPASEMFGKIMSISDEQMESYYTLLLSEKIPEGGHPMEFKKTLAQRLVTRYHSAEAAAAARQDFEQRFSKRDLASADLPVVAWSCEFPEDVISLVVFLFERAFQKKRSRSEVRRLLEGGSLSWEGQKIAEPNWKLPSVQEIGQEGKVLKLSRKEAVRIVAS